MESQPAKKPAKKPAEPAPATEEVTGNLEPEPYVSTKRPVPPVLVPRPIRPGANNARALQVMLFDLGHYTGRTHGRYDNALRNSVSMLQQDLAARGFYDGVPHGAFDAATRDALLASDIPTTEA